MQKMKYDSRGIWTKAAAVLAVGIAVLAGPNTIRCLAAEESYGCDGINPVADFRTEDGELIYGGDPAVLVDGDTVYLYTGHDVSTEEEIASATYNIPEYLCYSSKDLVNWTLEGTVLDMKDVAWASNATSAWASQTTKHYSEAEGKDLYYLYYCSWDKKSGNKQSIGVAVADSPTGPFVDIGEPLVRAGRTKPESSGWNDIDPTVWVDTDEAGEEHRYLAWGNSLFYICELNEDMISVKDQNGDGKITSGASVESADIISKMTGLSAYTEAPWLYRRQDEEGAYYGDYYLFYASGWREGMAYSTAKDPMGGEWTEPVRFMEPTTTSNTNHEAVFDFQGKTYFMYHNGSLPGGNGYRRSACLQELHFNEDGSVQFMEESTAGVGGEAVTISLSGDAGQVLSHEHFVNSSDDSYYPYMDIPVGTGVSEEEGDTLWVFTAGKTSKSDGDWVSIESENKTGMYLTAGDDGKVLLSTDADATEEMAAAQTFLRGSALNEDAEGFSLESCAYPGQFLTVAEDGTLALTDGADAEACSFR